jgi:hypothetical protein
MWWLFSTGIILFQVWLLWLPQLRVLILLSDSLCLEPLVILVFSILSWLPSLSVSPHTFCSIRGVASAVGALDYRMWTLLAFATFAADDNAHMFIGAVFLYTQIIPCFHWCLAYAIQMPPLCTVCILCIVSLPLVSFDGVPVSTDPYTLLQ